MKHSVGIIGLGRIGMTYDREVEDASTCLSHSKSFFLHPGFELTFLMDIHEGARREAMSRFPGVPVLEDIAQVRAFPEVMVLASKPEVNLKYMLDLQTCPGIRQFVVEKPFWSSLTPSGLLDEGRIFVNYTRKYLPRIKRLRQEIAQGTFGRLVAGTVYYSKGLRNNGSHFLDLVRFLLNPAAMGAEKPFKVVEDHMPGDHSYSFVLRMECSEGRVPIVFQALDEGNYSLVEMDLFFDHGRIRMHDFDGKLDVFRVEEDPLFPGYRNLLPEVRNSDSGYGRYGFHLCEEILGQLQRNEVNISSVRDEKVIFDLVSTVRSL